jgi:CRP-like cAMP-binding protein
MMETFTALEVLKRFESLTGLRLPNVSALIGSAAIIQLRERESAFRENAVHPYFYVVRSGLLKQLYTKEDGTEWIKSFTLEGQLFAFPIALCSGRRTTFASVAIEPSVIERIDYRRIEALGETDLVWQKAIRFAFQYLADFKLQRERDLLLLSAEDLYRKFA